MRILYISGYPAWEQISEGIKPSHHLFGMHQLIERYEKRANGQIYGVLKNIFNDGERGEVDFYVWESSRKDIIKHLSFMLTKCQKYDIVYDTLNRCSMWIGPLKKMGLFKPFIVTIMHHPSFYNICLKLSDSDAYIFFDDEYKNIAEKLCKKKNNKYYVNNWYPDRDWYKDIEDDGHKLVQFIDNGKSKRDRQLMIEAAERAKVRVDYAGNENQNEGYARAYKMDMSSYIQMAQKLKNYKYIVVPIVENRKYRIGPLGITSFLDCMAIDCPVITSDNTCFANDVVKYNLGRIYKTGDVDSLIKVFKELNGNELLYIQMRENISLYSKDRTIEKYAKNLLQIFQMVISKSGEI